MRKKLAVLLMSVLMAIGMLSATAFAADNTGTGGGTDLIGDNTRIRNSGGLRFATVSVTQEFRGIAEADIPSDFSISYKTTDKYDTNTIQNSGTLRSRDAETGVTSSGNITYTWIVEVYGGTSGTYNGTFTCTAYNGYDVTGYSINTDPDDMPGGSETGYNVTDESKDDDIAGRLYNYPTYTRLYSVYYDMTVPEDADISATEPENEINKYPANSTYPVDSTYKPDDTLTDPNTGNVYTFSGWKMPDGTVVTDPQTMGTADVTLTGEWTLSQVAYTVKFYYENGDGTYSQAATGSPVTRLANAGTETVSITDADKEPTVTDPNYVYDAVESESTVSAALQTDGSTVLKVYFSIDEKGDTADPDDPSDETPDRYQAPVTFTVVNGSWSDGTTEPKTVYVDLYKDGKLAVNGTGKLTEEDIPTKGEPNEGYNENGSWDKTPTTGQTIDKDGAAFTYTFPEEYTVIYRYEGLDDVTFAAGTTPVAPTDSSAYVEGASYTVIEPTAATAKDACGNTYTFQGWKNGDTPVSGTQTMGNADVTLTGTWELTDAPYVVAYYYETTKGDTKADYIQASTSEVRTGTIGGTVSATAADKTTTRDDYVFDEIVTGNDSSTTLAAATGSTMTTLKVYFSIDEKGDTANPDDPSDDPSDETPDRYQAPVTFTVVNGSWSDGTADVKTVYVDLYKDGKLAVNGTGKLTDKDIPTKGEPDEGYNKDGSWDTTPTTSLTISSSGAAFTYTFPRGYDVTYTYTNLPEDAIDPPTIPAGENDLKTGDPYTVGTTPKAGDTVEDPDGNVYTFDGWKTPDGTPVEPGDKTMGEEDVKLTGNWTLTSAPYVVEYYYEKSVGGEYELASTSDDRTDGTIGSTVSATNADKTPTKENYVFDGNRTENVLSTTLEAAETNGDTKTVTTLKVYFSIDKAGTNDSEPNNDPDKTPDEEPDGTPDRYQAKVTFNVVNGDWNDGTDEPKTAYVTLYNKGTPDEDGIGYLDGDDIPTVGDKPDTGYESGYDTNNWDTLPKNNTVVTANGPDSFTYTYVLKEVTVSFDPDGGTPDPDDQTVDYGSTATEPTDPTRPGYTFTGWTLDGEPYDFDTPVTDNITLEAQWTPNTYTVSFDPQGGTPDPDDQPVTYGSTATEPEKPTKDGYIFVGWIDPDTNEPYDFSTPVTEDKELTAKWIPVDYTPTLTYETNGGSSIDPETYPLDTEVTLDKQPTREGYTFTGWYADPELTTPISSITMSDDATVYAGWEANTVPSLLNGDDHYAYIIGYPDGTVRPSGNITRAEATTIFFRLLASQTRSDNLSTVNSFTDVSTANWFNTATSTMANLNIISGYSDGTFGGNKYITRAEFATICARFDTENTQVSSGEVFSDISGHWAENYIKIAAAKGWVSGYPDGSFHPNEYITRAEAATMINRVLLRLPESESDLLSSMTSWPDNPTDAWYYLAMQEATNSHDFDRKSDLIHETWTVLTETPDWAQYEKTN